MSDTAIQWTQGDDGSAGKTWNPIAAFDRETGKRGWFCVHASRGCDHCYAEAFNRFRGNGHTYTAQHRDQVECRIVDSVLDQPLRWRTPRRVFVCSMTDLFLDEHTDAMIDRVFLTMARARQHTFIVLTKRAKRMREYCNARLLGLPLPNVWGGVTCENQKTADERVPDLVLSPFVVRWVSAEPALEYVDVLAPIRDLRRGIPYSHPVAREGNGIDWLVIGGESGAGARPFDLAWARRMAGEAKAHGVSVFVKQLGRRPIDTLHQSGGWFPHDDRSIVAAELLNLATPPNILLLKDSHGGDMGEWPDDLRVREFPAAVTV